MRVESLGYDDADRWKAYVGPRARSVTELFEWRHVARDAYGITSHFLIAEDGSQTVGALALYEIKHPVFGHYLATALFATDGGLFFESNAARDALVAEARTLADRLRASYLLIRSRDVSLSGSEADDTQRTAIITLNGDAEQMLARLPGKTRNQVRRGQKEGFSIATGDSEIAAFHAVFHMHMRRLGTPAHSLGYYESIARHLGDRAQFFVVRDGNDLVAGALQCFVNTTSANIHTVALVEYNPRCPNYLLYWRMIEESLARGCRELDLGRSAVGSSQLSFKENWNPQIVPLHYNYFVRAGHERPHLDPRNPRYRVAIAAWQRLPLTLTRAIGPHIISGIA